MYGRDVASDNGENDDERRVASRIVTLRGGMVMARGTMPATSEGGHSHVR